MASGCGGSKKRYCGVADLGSKSKKRWDARAYRAWIGQSYRKFLEPEHKARELISMSQGHDNVEGSGFEGSSEGVVVECTGSVVANMDESCGCDVDKAVNDSRDELSRSYKKTSVGESEQSTGGVLSLDVPCVEFREEKLGERLLEKEKCASGACSKLGPSHARELFPELSAMTDDNLQKSITAGRKSSTVSVNGDSQALEVEKGNSSIHSDSLANISSSPADPLAISVGGAKSSDAALRMDDVQEVGKLLKLIGVGIQHEASLLHNHEDDDCDECLRCSTRREILETPAPQNCRQNSKQTETAAEKGLDMQQKVQDVHFTCPVDKSLDQIGTNYSVTELMETKGLQEKKFVSVPSEDDELEEGEIREAEGELMKEFGGELLELEEGEIRQTETGLSSVSVTIEFNQGGVSNQIMSKAESVGTVCLSVESADVGGASKACSVAHQTENEIMENFSMGKKTVGGNGGYDVEKDAGGANLASSHLKKVELPCSALLQDGANCESHLSYQLSQDGDIYGKLVVKLQNVSEVALGNAEAAEVVEAAGAFNVVHTNEDDEVANVFTGEEAVTDIEQHSADVNFVGVHHLAEVTLGNAESADVVEAAVACSVVCQNEDGELANFSTGEEAVNDNEQCNADVSLDGVILSSSRSGDPELLHSASLYDNAAECSSQFSSSEGHREELPLMPGGVVQHMEISPMQVETVSKDQHTLVNIVVPEPDNNSEIHESEAMVDELLQGIEICPIGLPIQLPVDGSLSSQVDRLSFQGRSEQFGGTSAGLDGMVTPSGYFGQSLQMHPVAAFGPSPVLYSDPLQLEAQKILLKMESYARKHDEQIKRYKAEREKEIEEVNKKYFNLIQNAVRSNLERQVSLDTICYKIHLNLQLADAYRMKVGNNWTSAQGLSTITPMEDPLSLQLRSPQQSAFNQFTQNSVLPQRPVQPQVVRHPSELVANSQVAVSYRHPSSVPRPTVQPGSRRHSTAPHLSNATPQSFNASQSRLLNRLHADQVTQLATAPSVYHPLLRPINVTVGGTLQRLGTGNLRPILPCNISAAQFQHEASTSDSPLGTGPWIFPNRQEFTQPGTMDGTGHRIA